MRRLAMWITDDGVAHTVSPPRWQVVVEVVLDDRDAGAIVNLASSVDELRDALFERIARGEVATGPAQALPLAAFRFPPSADGDGIEAWLQREVPAEWHLDDLDALELAFDAAVDGG